MFSNREPSNVVYLAAELVASSRGLQKSPTFAARLATDLCSIGRAYKATAERLCNGIRDGRGEWSEVGTTKAEKRLGMLKAKAKRLLKEHHRSARIETHDLHLAVVSAPGRETALL